MNRIFVRLRLVLLWTSPASVATFFTLTWQDYSPDEDGFSVERATAATGPFSRIAALSPNVTSYLNTNLPDATNLCYRVNAFNLAV